MDLITLAMAKAYTDEKVSGGGSGSGLPFVQLETPIQTGGSIAEFSEAECAAFAAAVNAGKPAMVSFNVVEENGTFSVCGIATLEYAETGEYCYVLHIMIPNQMPAWVVFIEGAPGYWGGMYMENPTT